MKAKKRGLHTTSDSPSDFTSVPLADTEATLNSLFQNDPLTGGGSGGFTAGKQHL